MRIIRTGVCLVLTFEVLAFGGVTEAGKAILAAGAAGLLLVWGWMALRERHVRVQHNSLWPPLLGLIAVGLAQFFFGISAYRYGTKVELLGWAAILVLSFLTAESFRATEDAKVFAWFLAGFGFFVSLFGIVQHFAFNGKLYWIVPMEAGGGAFGPFVDRDHFAGFVELTVPIGAALLIFRACRREQMAILGLVSVVPIGALIRSGSRGGILSLLVELIVLLYFWRKRNAGARSILGIALLLVAASAFVVWLGSADTLQRFQRLKPGDLRSDQRLIMCRDTWRIFVQHFWTGTGLGTLRIVYPQYESEYNQPGIDHAHNDYLELLAEEGVLGGLCGLGCIAALFWQGLALYRSAESATEQALYAGSLAACSGLLVHSLVDFNFHIPSNALLFFVLSAMATTKREESRQKELMKNRKNTE